MRLGSQAARLKIAFRRSVAIAMLVSGGGLTGCNAGELDDCDEAAARQLVYSSSGAVATKGQALAHDSCGTAAYCHSARATGKDRHGAPWGMNFDMLPRPTGVGEMLKERERSWELVESGEMPPPASGALVGNSDWSVDPQGHPDAPRLPALSTDAGKAAFRNWLACGAPTVVQTELPAWAQDQFGPGKAVTWDALYSRILVPTCASAGTCHQAELRSGGFGFDTEHACEAFRALSGRGDSNEQLVVPGDPEASQLMVRLECEDTTCGGPMPPTGRLPQAWRDALRRWIEEGAKAEDCP